MKGEKSQARRWLTVVVALVLPLFVAPCSKKPALKPMIPSEPTYNTSWKTSTPDKELLPGDRLEALGDIALQNRNFGTSLVNYLDILKDHPERYDLRYKVGVILLLSGQLEPAKKQLAMVLVQKPDMLKAHEALGLVHLQEKEYPLAIQEFQIVLSQDPKRAKTHHLLGVTFLEAGQPGKAIYEFKKAVDLEPRQVSSLAALGQAYLQLKEYQNAITYLQKARAWSPQNEKINYQLGMALAGLKRYPEAMEAFMKAGDEAQAYNNIGVHYFLEGQYEEAAKCFQRAIELRPVFYQEAKTNLQRALDKIHQTRKDGS
jgi:tetratricopeptide (TPR) repeat protein